LNSINNSGISAGSKFRRYFRYEWLFHANARSRHFYWVGPAANNLQSIELKRIAPRPRRATALSIDHEVFS
jgi:hypothetical protein